jgi:hypothetical protein
MCVDFLVRWKPFSEGPGSKGHNTNSLILKWASVKGLDALPEVSQWQHFTDLHIFLCNDPGIDSGAGNESKQHGPEASPGMSGSGAGATTDKFGKFRLNMDEQHQEQMRKEDQRHNDHQIEMEKLR